MATIAVETAGNITDRKRIGELLIDAGILRAEELPVGLEQARDRSLRLGEVLVMLRYVSAEDLESVLQAQTMLDEGVLSEPEAVAALKIASSHRLAFDKALRQVELAPAPEKEDELSIICAIQSELAKAEETHGPDDREIAPICLKLGDARLSLKQYPEAEMQYRRALQICEHSWGQKHLKVAQCLAKLAELHFLQRQFSEAATLAWRQLEIIQSARGAEHPDLAKCHRFLARVNEAQGNFKEAEQFYLSSLKLQEKLLGPDHPDMADGLRQLASFWRRQGKKPERKRIGDLLVEAGIVPGEDLKEAVQYTQLTNIPLGQALVKLSMVTEDELRPALQAQLLVGDGTLPVQLAVSALRTSAQKKIPFDDALRDLGWEPDTCTTQELRTLLAAAEELMTAELALGAEHAGVAVLSLKLGDSYVQNKRYAEAEPLYKRAVGILERFFGPKDLEVAAALFKLASLYALQNKLLDAERLHWRALEIKQQCLGQHHLDVAESLDQLARLQVRQSNPDQAERLFQSSLSIKETVYGRAHPKVLESLSGLCDIYLSENKLTEAESALLRLIKVKQKATGGLHLDLVPILDRLADIYVRRNEYSKAETQYELAVEICENAGAEGLASMPDLLEKYAWLLRATRRAEEAQALETRSGLLRHGFTPT